MTGGPWLSILVPVYNVESYLEECVASIAEQADDRVEIILCDDASTDGSAALAEELVARHSADITLIRHQHNQGLSAARNTMIDAARGEYIWFVDSDDYLLPGAMDRIREAVTTHAPDVIGGHFRKRGRLQRGFAGVYDVVLTRPDIFVSGVFAARRMYSWLKISRRDLWAGGLRFPVGKAFEDVATTGWLMLAAKSYLHLDHPLLEYRIRPGSILSGITRIRDRFNAAHHRDLAHALDGFAEALDAQGPQAFRRTRLAVSHFLAMEFARICLRIRRASPDGLEGADPAALMREFRRAMEVASPLPFSRLNREYLKRGRLLAFTQLSLALVASR